MAGWGIEGLFAFLVALFVTLVAIPVLMRVSGTLGLVDLPNSRKVHSVSVPRCGGLAIAVGLLLPILMWLPIDRALAGYLAGACAILLFGLWDDIQPLHYKWKLIGQCVAVAFVMSAGIVLHHLPFFGLDPAPPFVTYPVTFFLLLGIVNAVNLFDGLDGLAGGCVLLTLTAIAILAYQSGGYSVFFLALAAMGGILGFLRYNTHPASVFMGDSGSQLLGLTTAVLAILLIEDCNPALNPSLLFLLLGLPILDTSIVILQRVGEKRSPFVGDKNHIHHKLLAVGFRHYEAVFFIYGVQGLMMLAAFLLRYEDDLLLLSIFTLISIFLLGLLQALKHSGWRAHRDAQPGSEFERRNLWLRRQSRLPEITLNVIQYFVAGFLVLGAILPAKITEDFEIVTLSVAALSVAALLLIKSRPPIIERATVYLAVVTVAYLFASWTPSDSYSLPITRVSLVILAIALVLGIRLTRRVVFQVTPQDLLILFLAITVPNLSGETLTRYPLGETTLIAVLLLYASEFIHNREPGKFRSIHFASIAALSVIGVRGVLS